MLCAITHLKKKTRYLFIFLKIKIIFLVLLYFDLFFSIYYNTRDMPYSISMFVAFAISSQKNVFCAIAQLDLLNAQNVFSILFDFQELLYFI